MKEHTPLHACEVAYHLSPLPALQRPSIESSCSAPRLGEQASDQLQGVLLDHRVSIAQQLGRSTTLAIERAQQDEER